MATSLEDLIRQISPFDALANPTGNKQVKYPPERQSIKANVVDRAHFAVFWDTGSYIRKDIVELIGFGIGTASETWDFVGALPFADKKEKAFLNDANQKIADWWAATGSSVYSTYVKATVYDFDLGIAQFNCLKIDRSGASPTVDVVTIMVDKGDTFWIHRTQRISGLVEGL